VGVDGLHHDVDGGFGFHRGDGFGDDLEAFRADDVNAEDFAVWLTGDYLDEPFVVAEDGGAAVAGERKTADLDLAALGARWASVRPTLPMPAGCRCSRECGCG